MGLQPILECLHSFKSEQYRSVDADAPVYTDPNLDRTKSKEGVLRPFRPLYCARSA